MRALLESVNYIETSVCSSVNEDDGTVTVMYIPLGLAANGGDQDEAVADLIDQVRLYADVYLEDPGLYLRDPQRRSHIPFLLAATTYERDEDLAKFLRLP